jgi:hypothetical protein
MVVGVQLKQGHTLIVGQCRGVYLCIVSIMQNTVNLFTTDVLHKICVGIVFGCMQAIKALAQGHVANFSGAEAQ